MTWKSIANTIKRRFDILYDENDCGDFIELTGIIGGDVLCYRIYKKDGSVVVR